METRLIGRAREALDSWRYDPPAWTGTNVLIVVVLILFGTIAVYIKGAHDGARKVRSDLDAQIEETTRRVKAESQARIVRIAGELEAERAKAATEQARFEEREAALLQALAAAAKAPATQVAGSCETPVAPLNAVIGEVNRARR